MRHQAMHDEEMRERYGWAPPEHQFRGFPAATPEYSHGSLLEHGAHNPFRPGGLPVPEMTPVGWHSGGWEGLGDEMEDKANHPYVRDAAEHVHRVVSAAHPAINIGTFGLHKVLDDGRFKSLFETDRSNGSQDKRMRAAVEEGSFGYPGGHHTDRNWDPADDPRHYLKDQTAPHHRPIYGSLVHDPLKAPSGSASQYGEHTVILHKPSIWHRTTVTLGDSLGRAGHVLPRPAESPGIHAADSEPDWAGDSWADDSQQRLRRRLMAHSPEHYKTADDYPGRYIEAQYHGGVGTHHIHYVVLGAYADSPRDQELKGRLDKAQIPWIQQTYRHDAASDRVSEGIGDRGRHARLHHSLVRYQELLVESSRGGGMSRIVAQRGPGVYLIDLGDGQGQVADIPRGILFEPTPLNSILARGYWTDPKQPVDVDEVLPLVRPQV